MKKAHSYISILFQMYSDKIEEILSIYFELFEALSMPTFGGRARQSYCENNAIVAKF